RRQQLGARRRPRPLAAGDPRHRPRRAGAVDLLGRAGGGGRSCRAGLRPPPLSAWTRADGDPRQRASVREPRHQRVSQQAVCLRRGGVRLRRRRRLDLPQPAPDPADRGVLGELDCLDDLRRRHRRDRDARGAPRRHDRVLCLARVPGRLRRLVPHRSRRRGDPRHAVGAPGAVGARDGALRPALLPGAAACAVHQRGDPERRTQVGRGRPRTAGKPSVSPMDAQRGMTRFQSPADVKQRLAAVDYLADEDVAVTVYLADRLAKPILCEGAAGVGETEALLLEVLSEWQVSIPELGTISATRPPLVVLTSNNTRELSEALKRRCLFLHMGYPDIERETRIIRARIPEIDAALAEQVARVVRSIRSLELKKPPSVSETLDWARTLLLLGVDRVDADVTRKTLSLLLKYQQDIDKVSHSPL